MPDLIGYQTMSPADLTAAELPASSGGSGSGGSGDTNVINVFNVFDVETVGSNAPSEALGLGQSINTGSTVSPEQSQVTSFSAMTEQDLRATEAGPVTAPAAPPAGLVDLDTFPRFASALGALFISGPTGAGDASADPTHFDDVAGALVAAINGGTSGSAAKPAGLDLFWADFGDGADETTIGQEQDVLSSVVAEEAEFS